MSGLIKVLKDRTTRDREIECNISDLATQIEEHKTQGWDIYDISVLDAAKSGRATISATQTTSSIIRV